MACSDSYQKSGRKSSTVGGVDVFVKNCTSRLHPSIPSPQELYFGQPENNRVCPMCQNDVESKFHVLIDCDFYLI